MFFALGMEQGLMHREPKHVLVFCSGARISDFLALGTLWIDLLLHLETK